MKLIKNGMAAVPLSCAMLALATAPGALAAGSATERLLPNIKRAVAPMQSVVPSAQPQRGGLGVCGDSILDAGEQCDDGNAADGDGCSSTCQVESGFECTLPIPGMVENGVPEGGFEGGSPSPAWTEASVSFGTPLCTVALCGTGTGTGPASGDWWAWFGGIAASEIGSVEQSLVIETTDTTLSFAVEQISCDSPSDFAQVLIDGNVVFFTDGGDPACGVPGYRTEEIDLATAVGGPYNDGLSHTLRIESEIFAVNLEGSNFFFDDITLNRGVGPGTPSECSLLPNICSSENFDTMGLTLWTLFNDGPLPLDWGTTDDGFCGSVNVTPGNYTGGTGVAACIDSDAAGNGVTNSYLCSPPLDLSETTGASLEFLYNFQVFSATGEDAFEVLAGTAAPDLTTIGGYTSVFLTNSNAGILIGAGASESIDLAAFDGSPEAYVCFRHSGDFDWYAQVDDVEIIAESCGGGAPDTDEDGITDDIDNCTNVPNATQIDTNGDGIGNACDADFDQNCIVNFSDLGTLKATFFSNANPDTDLNGDNITNFADLGILKQSFFMAPGPSATPCEVPL